MLLFAGIGLVATVYCSPAMPLDAVADRAVAGAAGPDQALAVAVGSNLGSSVGTAVVGMLGGQQRAAAGDRARCSTGVTAALPGPLPLWTWLVKTLAGLAGFGGNDLLQLALFHPVQRFGVLLFWPWQGTAGGAAAALAAGCADTGGADGGGATDAGGDGRRRDPGTGAGAGAPPERARPESVEAAARRWRWSCATWASWAWR